MDDFNDYFPPSEEVEGYKAFLEAPGEALGIFLGDVEAVQKSEGSRKMNTKLVIQQRFVRRNGKTFAQKFYVRTPEAAKPVEPARAAEEIPVEVEAPADDKEDTLGIKRDEFMLERNPFKQSEDPTAYAAFEVLKMGFKKDEKITFKKMRRNLRVFVDQFYEGDVDGVTSELLFYLMAHGAITGPGSTPEKQFYIPFDKKLSITASSDPVAFMAYVRLKKSEVTTFEEAEKVIKPIIAASYSAKEYDIDAVTQEMICYLIEKNCIKLGRDLKFVTTSTEQYTPPKDFSDKTPFDGLTVLAALLAKTPKKTQEHAKVFGKVSPTALIPADAQKVIRKQFAAILAEHGMTTREPVEVYGYKDDSEMPHALAYHEWNGTTIARKSVHEDLIGFFQNPNNSTRLQRDAVRTMIHEELHGHSPMTSLAYHSYGCVVEEVTTEVAARVLVRRKFKFTDPEFRTNNMSSYGDWIEQVVQAIAEGAGVKREEAVEMLEHASIAIKKKHPRDTTGYQYKATEPREILEYFLDLLPIKNKAPSMRMHIQTRIEERIKAIRGVR